MDSLTEADSPLPLKLQLFAAQESAFKSSRLFTRVAKSINDRIQSCPSTVLSK